MTASSPKIPTNYRVVLDAVNEFGDGRHASADDVFRHASRRRPGIGFTTVHRGLARLHELGLVLKLDISGEGQAMYEPATAAHAHFRCSGCGSVADVDYACAPDALAALEASHGLRIHDQSITFTGLCRSCGGAPPASPP
jgi:Fur family ferric uptake transcriptional regulator